MHDIYFMGTETLPSKCYILSDKSFVTYFPTNSYILSDESDYILSDESRYPYTRKRHLLPIPETIPSACHILSVESSILLSDESSILLYTLLLYEYYTLLLYK